MLRKDVLKDFSLDLELVLDDLDDEGVRGFTPRFAQTPPAFDKILEKKIKKKKLKILTLDNSTISESHRNEYWRKQNALDIGMRSPRVEMPRWYYFCSPPEKDVITDYIKEVMGKRRTAELLAKLIGRTTSECTELLTWYYDHESQNNSHVFGISVIKKNTRLPTQNSTHHITSNPDLSHRARARIAHEENKKKEEIRLKNCRRILNGGGFDTEEPKKKGRRFF